MIRASRSREIGAAGVDPVTAASAPAAATVTSKSFRPREPIHPLLFAWAQIALVHREQGSTPQKEVGAAARRDSPAWSRRTLVSYRRPVNARPSEFVLGRCYRSTKRRRRVGF